MYYNANYKMKHKKIIGRFYSKEANACSYELEQVFLLKKDGLCVSYTAVSRKVVQKKCKSVRDNAERHYGTYSIK